MSNFKNSDDKLISASKYNIKLSEESFRMLKEFVKTKNSKPLVDLIKENIMLESNLAQK